MNQQRKSDATWAELNRRLDAAIVRNDWGEMSAIYFELAPQLSEEGKSHLLVAQEGQKAGLQGYQGSGVVGKVRIVTAGDKSCESCRLLEGKELTIREALSQMPIPNPACTTWKREEKESGWCRCVYVPVLK